MKSSHATFIAAFAGAAFLISATLGHAALDGSQIEAVVVSNSAAKSDRLQTPASSEQIRTPASPKGDLLPIAGSRVPAAEVMMYQTGPGASTVLPLPAMVLNRG